MSRKLEDLLMRRDDITRKEAKDLISECRDELESGNWNAIAEVIALEDDYIFDILE